MLNGGDLPILMTEAYINATEYVKYFKSKSGTLLSQMPFNFALITDLSKGSTAADIKATIDGTIATVPNGMRLNWVIGNHDQPRVGSHFGAEKIADLLTLVMTLPVIAITYYVNEFENGLNITLKWALEMSITFIII